MLEQRDADWCSSLHPCSSRVAEQPVINCRCHDPVALGPRVQMIATVDRSRKVQRLLGIPSRRIEVDDRVETPRVADPRVNLLARRLSPGLI